MRRLTDQRLAQLAVWRGSLDGMFGREVQPTVAWQGWSGREEILMPLSSLSELPQFFLMNPMGSQRQ